MSDTLTRLAVFAFALAFGLAALTLVALIGEVWLTSPSPLP